jgi:hypothetical protein
MARIIADRQKETCEVRGGLAVEGDEDRLAQCSAQVSHYVASNGGVSNSNQGKGGDHKAKRIDTAIYFTSCGLTFASNDCRAIRERCRLHKKVCPICRELKPGPTRVTQVLADAIDTRKVQIDVSGSRLENI